MNLKRYIDAAVRREVRRYLCDALIDDYKKADAILDKLLASDFGGPTAEHALHESRKALMNGDKIRLQYWTNRIYENLQFEHGPKKLYFWKLINNFSKLFGLRPTLGTGFDVIGTRYYR